jgi:hypothetical protein
MEVCLEVSTEKMKCMVMSCHQNAGQSYNVLIVISPLKLCQSSSVWESSNKLKLLFRKKLRAD